MCSKRAGGWKGATCAMAMWSYGRVRITLQRAITNWWLYGMLEAEMTESHKAREV
jgi:hypothetical protein